MCERYMEALTFVCPPAHSAGSDVTLELLMTWAKTEVIHLLGLNMGSLLKALNYHCKQFSLSSLTVWTNNVKPSLFCTRMAN